MTKPKHILDLQRRILSSKGFITGSHIGIFGGIDYSDLLIGLLEISPSDCAAWLDFSAEVPEHERLQRDKIVLATVRYGHDMIRGQFCLAESAVLFSPDGHQVNGQQRCIGARDAGASFVSLVGVNFPVECCKRIDHGVVRRLFESLSIGGNKAASRELDSLMRNMLSGARGPRILQKTTVEDYAEFYERYQPHLDFALTVPGIKHGYLRAVIARAHFNGHSKEKLLRFAEVFSQEPFQDSERAAAALPAALAALKTARDMYWLSQTSLWLFLKGEPRKLLRLRTENFFPIPEDIVVPEGQPEVKANVA